MAFEQRGVRNYLLARLSPSDFALLRPHLSSINLAQRDQLVSADAPMGRSYFIESGIVSVVAGSADGRQTEVGLIGREGLVDVVMVLGGVMTPLQAVVQAPGTALVLPSAALREAEHASPTLRAALLGFAQSMLIQVSYTVVATASMTINERLARWLLMSHDRMDGDRVPMTHESLALMLNVRRAGVTVAVSALEAAGAVKAQRGGVEIVDRNALLAIAKDGYGAPELARAEALAL